MDLTIFKKCEQSQKFQKRYHEAHHLIQLVLPLYSMSYSICYILNMSMDSLNILFVHKQYYIFYQQKTLQMAQRCLNCQLTHFKLNQLMCQYEQLIRTKQEEIACSHRIITELGIQLSESKRLLISNGMQSKQFQKNTHKIMVEQQQTIEYLKQRQIKLVQQLKNTQNQIFKLAINIDDNNELTKQKSSKQKSTLKEKYTQKQDNQNRHFVTPKKSVMVSNSGNVTLNKQRENNTFDRIFQESTIRLSGSDHKDTLRLKVTEDKLQLMNIKYQMALLKTVQVATLR